MPTYVYKCESEKCGKVTEESHSINSYPQFIVCPEKHDSGFTPKATIQIQAMSYFEIHGDNSGSTKKRPKH